MDGNLNRAIFLKIFSKHLKKLHFWSFEEQTYKKDPTFFWRFSFLEGCYLQQNKNFEKCIHIQRSALNKRRVGKTNFPKPRLKTTFSVDLLKWHPL